MNVEKFALYNIKIDEEKCKNKEIYVRIVTIQIEKKIITTKRNENLTTL